MPRDDTYYRCPVCDGAFEPDIERRVDVPCSPEVGNDLTRGRFNTVRCPDCGHDGVASEPVFLVGSDLIVGYVPVVVPPNRKASVVRRLQRELAGRVEGKQRSAICFGPRQLRRELAELPWQRWVPAAFPSFDDPGTPDHRRQALDRVRRERPDDAGVLTRLGRACYDMRRYRDARRALMGALNVDPGNTDALLLLASVNLDDGRPVDALAAYDRLVAVTHDPGVRFLSGVAAIRAGRTADAIERLQVAVRDQPDNLDALVWLANAHATAGDRAGALSALRTAGERGLRDPNIIYQHEALKKLSADGGFRAIVAAIRKQDEQGKRERARASRGAGDRRERGPARGPRKKRR